MFKMMMKASAVFSMALGATMVAPAGPIGPSPAYAGVFGKDCGGLGQKTCISFNKDKRCNPGLVERRQSGRNICVRKTADRSNERDCGGLNQKTCISLSREKRCNAGLVEMSRSGRNICVRPTTPPPEEKNCGGLNQTTCISFNPAKWCDTGLTVLRQPGRNICIRKADLQPGSDKCGGAYQQRCQNINPAKWCDAGFRNKVQFGKPDICVPDRVRDGRPCGGEGEVVCKSINPAKWCDDGLKKKIRWGQPDICIKKITNKDRLDVAGAVIREIGTENPLARLTKCVKNPRKLASLELAIRERSNNGVNRLLSECGANPNALQDMGKLASLNNGVQGGNDKKFKTLSITVGASGAAGVAAAGGAGILIELKKGPNARWFFTGGVGGGPKAEVVGDVTVGLSRSTIPTRRIGLDHGIGAVVSGHYIVGLSGGVEFEGNSLDFAGISFGAGGGAGVGGAVYKTGAIFPFKDL
ncbi:hypothetical protein [Erythrobacter sp. YT30]|uniref:hypothetical protein n=1 Tax=Erythrobacter sp. YT30 TaxID=1735012 RepID=UPI000B2F6C18|nr:hypothetical protein [Erythrobacter sp. YT30]